MNFVEEEKTNFENKIIIVGIPGMGNVGQLSIDLLINSLDGKRVGYFYTKFVLPVVGNSPFSNEKNDLHTRVEVFESSTFLFVQIRGPIYNTKEFSKNFVEFFSTKKIKNLIVLSSSNASWCVDKFLEEQQPIYRYLVEGESIIPEWIKKLDDEDYNKFIISTTKYLHQYAKEKKLNMNVIVTPCHEGDNTKEGIEMTARVLGVLQQKVPIKMPMSWKSFYGSAPSSSLY